MDIFLEIIGLVGAGVAGFFLGKWLPLPELKSRWNMFFLRAFIIFFGLQLGVIFAPFKMLIWGALLGYALTGFQYGAGLTRRTAVDPTPEPEKRTFPKPPVGSGKKNKRKK